MADSATYHFILIEDSKLDSFIGEKIIRSLGGTCISLTSFLDPEAALSYIAQREPDQHRTVVLLDIQMPLMTGFEFIERYEELVDVERQQNYVINILSSSINERDIARANSYKCMNAFLNKPLKRELLIELVNGITNTDS
jgi:CheY-like chemotaxis protein